MNAYFTDTTIDYFLKNSQQYLIRLMLILLFLGISNSYSSEENNTDEDVRIKTCRTQQ